MSIYLLDDCLYITVLLKVPMILVYSKYNIHLKVTAKFILITIENHSDAIEIVLRICAKK